MIEFSLMLLLVTAGGWWFAHQRAVPRAQRPATQGETFDHVIAGHGGFHVWSPGRPGRPRHFDALNLQNGEIVIRDAANGQCFYFPMNLIQWIQPLDVQRQRDPQLALHFEVDGTWRILDLHMAMADMILLLSLLNRAVPRSNRQPENAVYRPVGPLTARAAEQDLDGTWHQGPDVQLYLLPHLLVVLNEDVVLEKILTNRVRRVLALETQRQGVGKAIRQGKAGVMRLYSQSETVDFALENYQALADEIALLARCPVEHVDRDDKATKRD